jgi:hypothetical protein
MNKRKPFSDQDIDALVRAHLLRQEETVDADRILAAVRAGLAGQTGNDGAVHVGATAGKKGSGAFSSQRVYPPGSICEKGSRPLFAGRWRRVNLRLAMAAAILLAVFLSMQVGTTQVSAKTWVIDAQKAHAQPVDRCYLVHAEVAPDVLENYRLLPVTRESRLWTRGDRFWFESPRPDHKGGWGRDELGRVWFAVPNGKNGFRFEANEIPEGLRVACELRSMRIESLLKRLLVDYDLREEKLEADNPQPSRIVRATLKPGRQRVLSQVTIEMDTQSKVLRRVVLSRTYARAVSTITFTLVAEEIQKDDIYRLEGHLEPEAHVYSTEEAPPQRLQMLRKQYEMARPEKPVG